MCSSAPSSDHQPLSAHRADVPVRWEPLEQACTGGSWTNRGYAREAGREGCDLPEKGPLTCCGYYPSFLWALSGEGPHMSWSASSKNTPPTNQPTNGGGHFPREWGSRRPQRCRGRRRLATAGPRSGSAGTGRRISSRPVPPRPLCVVPRDVRNRGLLVREAALWDHDHECRVVQVTRTTPLEARADRFEELPAQSHDVLPGAQRDPVEIYRCRFWARVARRSTCLGAREDSVR
jgi:hypothetical protein